MDTENIQKLLSELRTYESMKFNEGLASVKFNNTVRIPNADIIAKELNYAIKPVMDKYISEAKEKLKREINKQ